MKKFMALAVVMTFRGEFCGIAKKWLVLLVALVVALGFGGTVYADLNDGLVAYYPFNGNANDESGNGNHGTEHNGLTYVQGVNGQAANFDGIDDYISADGSGELALSDWTLSTWIRPKSFPQLNDIVFLGKCEDSNSKYNYGLILTMEGHVRSQYEAANDNSDFDHTIGGGCYGFSPVQLNKWTHIISTRNASTGEHKLYINGELVVESQWFDTPITNNEELLFGLSHTSSAFTNGWLYNGDIDEVRIYDRALSEAEIQELYTPPSTCFTQADIDSAYQEGYEAGLAACGGGEPAILTADLQNLHIPMLRYNTAFEDMNLWVDFKYAPIDGRVLFEVEDFGVIE